MSMKTELRCLSELDANRKFEFLGCWWKIINPFFPIKAVLISDPSASVEFISDRFVTVEAES